MSATKRWLRILLGLYPADFRDEHGPALMETYEARVAAARRRRGMLGVAGVWLRALLDSARNGPAERVHPAAGWRRGGNWGRDAELVLRRLVRAPVFTLSVIGTLTVGLGAFAVVYTIVHQVLLRPLPYDRPDELYYVWRDYRPILDLDRGWTAGTDVVELNRAGGAIRSAVGLRRAQWTLSSSDGRQPEEIPVMLSTPNLFDVLGVKPWLGRGFRADEFGEYTPRPIILTHGLWQRLGGDESIVGRELRLNETSFLVIGVTGRDFEFVRHSSLGPPESADAFSTFAYDLAETEPGNGSFAALLRARPGASEAEVAAAVTAVGQLVDRRDFDGEGIKLYSVPMQPDLVAAVKPALTVVGVAAGFLVLVLLVNLASLLLVRAIQREREFAVARALGANPLALVRATVLESSVLGLAGGIGAASAAVWGVRSLVAVTPADLPRRAAIAMDWPIAAVVVGTGLTIGMLAGIAPAVWAMRTRLSTLLRAAAVRGGGGQTRMRRGMVVVQVALSLVLLCAGGLVVKSFAQLLRADPGFDPSGVLTMRIPISFETEQEAEATHGAIEQALSAVPGVTSVGSGSVLPLTADADQAQISAPGAPGNTGNADADAPLADFIAVRRGYIETLGMTIVEGTDVSPRSSTEVHEILIDEQLARQFYPNGSAVGTTMMVGNNELRVVGVVRHARLYDVHQDGRPQVYAWNQGGIGYGTLRYVVRSPRDPVSLIPEVRSAIMRLNASWAVSEIEPLSAVVDRALAQQRASATLIGGFSLGALLLAAMGLFGVVAGSVTRRKHELAVRLALGADHGRVLRSVLGEGARLILMGMLLGIPGIYLMGRVLQSVLVGVSPFDVATLVAVAAGLGGVAMLSCYLPARRVIGIDPGKALRTD